LGRSLGRLGWGGVAGIRVLGLRLRLGVTGIGRWMGVTGVLRLGSSGGWVTGVLGLVTCFLGLGLRCWITWIIGLGIACVVILVLMRLVSLPLGCIRVARRCRSIMSKCRS
jgi:hypothetical protein